MANLFRPHAPYNFIPFHAKGGAPGERRTEQIIVRYNSAKNLPGHDVIDSALHTGEIQITMTADTPVFISDGGEHFFRGPNGMFVLPGSSVRGMVRENMQILGFGIVRPGEDLDDYQLYYRELAASRGSSGDKLKEHYKAALGIESCKGRDGKSVSVPTKVRAGYLRNDNGQYYIQPVRGGDCIRIPRKDRALNDAGLAMGVACFKKIAYTAANGRLIKITETDDAMPGMERGVLLYTGKCVGEDRFPEKANARYLFPEADEEAPTVWISDADRISYAEDYKARENILKSENGFRKLPDRGEEKPVFYTVYDGHIYFGMSRYLRIGYKYPLSEGLPARWAAKWENLGDLDTPLDYTHAVLGFAEKNQSYRSRVSFGDFEAAGDPRESAPIKAILAGPKPSWYSGYVENGAHYNEEVFALRGYKQYWLHDPLVSTVDPTKEKVASTLRPLPKGTTFRGTVRFKNLADDELGLLLWALRLDEGCYQSIGMGKPLGFGRMKLKIDSLTEYDPNSMYSASGLCYGPKSADAEMIEKYIRAFDESACRSLYIKEPKNAPSIRSRGEIRDFFHMRSTIRQDGEVRYMELNEYKNLTQGLPTVRQMSKESKTAPEQPKKANNSPFAKLAEWNFDEE